MNTLSGFIVVVLMMGVLALSLEWSHRRPRQLPPPAATVLTPAWKPPAQVKSEQPAAPAPQVPEYIFQGVQLPHTYSAQGLSIEAAKVSVENYTNSTGFKTLVVELGILELTGRGRQVPWKDVLNVANAVNAVIAPGRYRFSNATTSAPYLSIQANGRIVYRVEYTLSDKDFPVRIAFSDGWALTAARTAR